jgi:hypothetical protein
MKYLENIIFLFNEINPCEFAKVINKTHVVVVSTNRSWGRPPFIGENKFKRNSRHTCGD